MFSQQSSFQLIRKLTNNEGLPGSNVSAILQDSRGFIWIGTDEGLSQFNGNEVKTFNFFDDEKEHRSKITVLFENDKELFFIGTEKGLFILNRKKDLFKKVYFNFSDGLHKDEFIKDISQNSDGTFVTTKNKIFCLPDSFQFNGIGYLILTPEYFFDFTSIQTVCNDKAGNIWISDNNCGLIKLSSQKNKLVVLEKDLLCNVLKDKIVTALYFDSLQNRLWIGTDKQKLYSVKFSGCDLKQRNVFDYLLKGKEIHDITSDRKGNILVATDDEIFRYSYTKNSIVPIIDYKGKRNSFVGHINKVFADQQKNLWIGTNNGSINLNENNNIYFFNKTLISPGISGCVPCNDVLSFIKDDKGNLMVGTDGNGIIFYDKTLKYTSNLSTANGFPDNVILTFFKDEQGKIWIGTYSHGIYIYDPESGMYNHLSSLAKKKAEEGYYDVRDIAEDSQGNIWIPTNGGGLFRYDKSNGDIERFRRNDETGNSISSDHLIFIYIDKKDNLLIGSYEGLILYDPVKKIFSNYKTEPKDPESINGNWVYSIAQDTLGYFWIGTIDGLNKFYGNGKFKRFNKNDGLPGNNINSIIVDDKGFFWITTENGISKFDPVKEIFVNFEEKEGLQDKLFVHGSGYRDNKGNIYFGGINGFNVFHPDSIRINTYVPKIVLTKFRIDNVEIAPGMKDSPLPADINEVSEIHLKYHQSTFSIEFSALNYINTEKNKYSYILEGFDKSWTRLKSNRPAIYTNIDPGTYTFKVMGSNDFGVWNSVPKELIIKISRPWYNSLVAKVLYMLLIVFILYIFRKYTIISVNFKNQLWLDHIEKQKLEELNKLKLQFFTNISHELRTPLTLIVGPLDKLVKNGNYSEEVKIISHNVFRLRTLVDQILDFRKIENDKMQLYLKKDDIVRFTNYLLFKFKGFVEQKNINLSFKSSLRKLEMLFDADKIEKIFTNILSNAIKYTSAGGDISVSFKLIPYDSENSYRLLIEIKDSGKGIDKEDIERIFERFYTSSGYEDSAIGTGIGLHLTRKLIELHNGKIHVNSSPGKGTVFSISLPIDSSCIISEADIKQTETIIYSAEEPEIYRLHRSVAVTGENLKTIVVIDDNIEICNYLEGLLCKEFYVLKEADSTKGLDLIFKYMPDLVISDVMMTHPDGYELCRLIKNDIRLSHIPVILLTAKVDIRDHITGFECGADEYIDKPFNEEFLFSRIHNLIKQRNQIKEHFIGKDGLVNTGVSAGGLDRIFMNKVLEIIKNNFMDADFGVNEIIDQMGMSRSVFYKKFKSLSVYPINDLIRNFRLNMAKELILTKKYSITEIAYQTGFSDPTYFSKVFKERFKVSPKEYVSNWEY